MTWPSPPDTVVKSLLILAVVIEGVALALAVWIEIIERHP